MATWRGQTDSAFPPGPTSPNDNPTTEATRALLQVKEIQKILYFKQIRLLNFTTVRSSAELQFARRARWSELLNLIARAGPAASAFLAVGSPANQGGREAFMVGRFHLIDYEASSMTKKYSAT